MLRCRFGKAAAHAVQAAFAYQGQGCSAVSRVLIEEAVHDEVLARMVEMVKSYRPALPDTPVTDSPQIGPMFNKRQMERTLEFVALAKREARLLAGGYRVVDPPFDKGYYLQPAICSLEDTDSELFMEEIFGPLLTVVSFKDEAHAIALANKCNFALSGSVWSKDFGKARGMAEAIRFGTVWTNNHLCFSHHSPWGGYKNTGWDREFGIDAIESFTEVKSIWLHP
ncbi:MAG: aldehyde dehydrogenase family protein [Opitutae bacterium]|nr:aldehyde dehydrogenase family protein [Opitutae bacterium]